jgi:large subunit ribosomal protein L23
MAEKKEQSKKKEKADKKEKKSRLSKIIKREKKAEPVKKEEKKIMPMPEDPFAKLKFVLMTEKAIQLIERENKLVFIVDKRCSRNDVKASAEAAFQSVVSDVKTMIDRNGRKKAFIKFKEPGAAGDIAMRLGII